MSIVAPYTGAWIEITAADAQVQKLQVAPYTGAWIEIAIADVSIAGKGGRSLHGSVD
ncbi:hypothetical protein [Caproicibacterium sp. XB2]|uniref:hypothetical protein n=1 Tax=Caproicibacterium sp. XB2 TaxID=3388458 RepID=UPI00384DD676